MLRTVCQTQIRAFKPVASKSAVRALATETYTEKQAKLGRPVSPHVTIYKFPAAALSSITNRVTGVVLTGGMIVIFIVLIFTIVVLILFVCLEFGFQV
jgi:hypothetical protein